MEKNTHIPTHTLLCYRETIKQQALCPVDSANHALRLHSEMKNKLYEHKAPPREQ